ncbi:MAG: hypothetical protein OXG66_13855 [Acidimicrobiaceae bacterium]|nr:hypothetical protein [Acidimicrobiaceae bacterium]
MAHLIEDISVGSRFARSANLERDIDHSEPLDGYVVTARALDVIERIAATAATGDAGGAWSLTGPYGSGKSSLALLLDAAFAADSQIRATAFRLIDEASRSVGDLLRTAHRRHGTESHGFHRGLVTAGREPLNRTVLSGLHAAVLRRFDHIPSTRQFRAAETLRGALEDADTDDPRRTGPSPSALVEVARCLAEYAPLLLVIDEFGKNLEAIRDGGNADPYLLQQLAEAGQGSGLPIFVLTLQHLSFEDHMAGTNGPHRREWAKVQGRFEDVAFVESAAQTRALIGTVFTVDDDSLRARIGRWAAVQARRMRALGVADLADPKTVASCYPLHPLAALVLPELCSRYGQHERTLFSFLTGSHPESAASFLAATELPVQGHPPALGLEAVYDYFVGSSALNIESARVSGRWTEIATRLRDSHGLTPSQARLAKAIALLNLVSTTGPIRASRQVLELTDERGNGALAELEDAGVITYRDFADEYRIWQGTDVDIQLLLDAARRRIERQSLVEILVAIDELQPLVAARHSAENDVLRVFRRRYASCDELVEPLDAFSRYDGEVLLVVDSHSRAPTMARPSSVTKPAVAAIPSDVTAFDAAAREVAAVKETLNDPSVADDWVARQELSERLAQARVAFDQALTDAFFNSYSCRWKLLGARQNPSLRRGRGSAAVSEAADRAYQATPRVRNEMLNRTELTSQGAKARSRLLKAMIEHGAEPDLGLKGYGPEVAMYRAFLHGTGLYDADTNSFRAPLQESMHLAWSALETSLKQATARRVNLTDLYAELRSPPFGMKAGAIPVFVTSALLTYCDEVAIYEHGTFKPLLTAELSERMVRNPDHFSLKHFANTTGARKQVIGSLTHRLDLRPSSREHRVANVLAVVGHLVSRISRLDNYTLRTHELTRKARRVRKALLTAVEPDELLFVSLPEALGLRAVPAHTQTYSKVDAYAASLKAAMDELTGNYERFRRKLLQLLLEASAEKTRLALMGQADALKGEVLDPEVRAFVLTLASDGIDDDLDWAKAVATVIAKKAPAEWTDDDLLRFQRELTEQFGAFHRLMALHSEHRAAGGGAFRPFRVTVTRTDGSEIARLVGVDHDHRLAAEGALDSTIDELKQIAGSSLRAHHTLLALLGERLLADSDSQADVSSLSEAFEHRVGNG